MIFIHFVSTYTNKSGWLKKIPRYKTPKTIKNQMKTASIKTLEWLYMVIMGPREQKHRPMIPASNFGCTPAGNRDGIYTSQYLAARYITASSKAEAGRRGFVRVCTRARASSSPTGTHTQAAHLHRAHTQRNDTRA